MNRRVPGAAFLWMALPVAIYLLILRHVWFDAPAWDDFDAMLDTPMMLLDAHSPGEWLETLFMQHNEHRIALPRLLAWGMARATGTIDFRVLVLFGNLAWVAVLALLWAEFRDKVADVAFMAAAFLMLQWSYGESSMVAMAALANMGVLLLALACLFFAVRAGRLNASLAAVSGVLAACTQANGLFALPLAAIGAAAQRRRGPALLFAVLAAIEWLAYFQGYARPAYHPSLMAALEKPLDAVQLFLIVLGGLVPGRWLPIPLGAAMVVVLIWLARRGAGRAHPACALWVLFALASAGAAAVGRVGLGVFHAPRYNLYSGLLLAIILPLAFETLQTRKRAVLVVTAVACAALSMLVTIVNWPAVHAASFNARLLTEAIPAEGAVVSQRYFGLLHPSVEWGERILGDAQRRRLFVPQRTRVESSGWVVAPAPATLPPAGHIDDVRVTGDRLLLKGWAHLPATLPGRVFTLSPGSRAPEDVKIVVKPRPDVALLNGRPDLLFAGFELELRYPSVGEAQAALRHVCLSVEARRHAPAAIPGAGGDCAR